MEKTPVQVQLKNLAKIRCCHVLKVTRNNADFDPKYIEEMLSRIEEDKHLTANQLEGINNIYESFGGE